MKHPFFKNIEEVNGLHFWAALIVPIPHSAGSGYLPRFLSEGFVRVGVALFHSLSGPLIVHISFNKNLNANEDASRDFYFLAALIMIALSAWVTLILIETAPQKFLKRHMMNI